MSHQREKTADQLQSFLGEQIRRMRDPRVQLVTVTAIEMSRDRKYATVFWSAPGKASVSEFLSDSEVADINTALTKAEKYLKHKISTELALRYVPELRFRYDASLAEGAKIDTLLTKAGL